MLVVGFGLCCFVPVRLFVFVSKVVLDFFFDLCLRVCFPGGLVLVVSCGSWVCTCFGASLVLLV